MTEKGYSPFADSDVDDSVETETGEGLWKGGEELASLYKGIDETYREAGVEPVPEFDDWKSMLRYNPNPPKDFLEKGVPKKLVPYWNALKDSGLSNEEAAARLSGMGTAGLASMREAYDTGYSFGGPMGTMQGIGRGIGTDYARELKLKKLTGKETKEEKEQYLSDLKDRIEKAGGTWTKSTKFEGMMSDYQKDPRVKDSTWRQVIGHLAPGNLITQGLAGVGNFLTETFGVLGEFITPEGKTFRVMDDGSLVEPDIYTPSQSDNDPMTSIQKPRPVQQASVSEEVEKPLTGIAAELDKRSEVASVAQSRQAQFDNIASIFGREEAAKMLNLPENIFA